MKPFLYALAGMATGAILVLATGFLEMRISAARDGVSLDANNEVELLVGSHIPVWLIVGRALLGVAAIAVLTLATMRIDLRESRTASAAFAALVLGIIVVSYMAWPYQSVPHVDDTGPYGGGLLGWIEYGGRSSAVQLVAVTAVLLASFGHVLRPRRPVLD
ncbi:hypothetical protein ACNI3K_06775 [Demequina sp. SO4-13]|uniref:hypothetical protein n=1 Tax=Demequina sp. SO4-13 TaxID=3401027 RepID=UPI003AF60B25